MSSFFSPTQKIPVQSFFLEFTVIVFWEIKLVGQEMEAVYRPIQS